MHQRSSLSNWSFSPYTNRKNARCLAPLPEAIVITAVQQHHCVPDDEVDDYKCNNKHSTSRKMEAEKQEAKNLQMEFEWVLREEVHQLLKKLKIILIVSSSLNATASTALAGDAPSVNGSSAVGAVAEAAFVECAHRFPVPLYENEGKKTEKFILSVQPPDQLKAIITLTGDTITQAEINFKLAKQPHSIQRTFITHDSPWKLQQVQDAANHLQQAINHIDDVDETYHFKTSDEVMHVVGNILKALQMGRSSLVLPKRKPIDELIKGRNMKSLSPNLSEDVAISFYLQSHKLIIAVYQLTNVHGTMRFDSCQAEASIHWLNDVLLMLSAGLQLCQQLKDKISVFSLYKDFKVGSRASSALSY